MNESTFKIEGFDNEINSINIESNTKKDIINSEGEKKQVEKFTLNIYQDDWEDIVKYRTFVITEKKINFSQADVIIYGLKLLEKKYKIQRGREKIKLQSGRRSNAEQREKRITSVELPFLWIDFLNDFFYHKMIVEGNYNYSKLEMISEMISLIKKENKNVKWQ